MGAVTVIESNDTAGGGTTAPAGDATSSTTAVGDMIVLQEEDQVSVTGPTDECPGGVISINLQPILCVGSPLDTPFGALAG
jgi:hypothetical protein